MTKTDKELANELTIAFLEHISNTKNSNGGSMSRPLTAGATSEIYKYFENVISGKTNPLVKKTESKE